jgi:hypothetical protein
MNYSERTSAIAGFADELRQARTYRRITTDEIAVRTRIRTDYLTSIESGRWEEIPAAYVRGYVMLYAEAVGMNRDKVMGQFDRLFSSSAEPRGAELGSDPPLLNRPQHVELPRSKIRAEWFAALVRNRQLSYLLSFLLVGGVVAGLYWSRSRVAHRTDVSGFGESVTESHLRVHSPNSVIAPDSSVMQILRGSVRVKTAKFVATAPVWVTIESPDLSSQRLHLMSFDTLTLQYLTEVRVAALPAGNGVMFDEKLELIPTRELSGDSAIFTLGRRENPVQNLLKDSLADSVSS